jgi:predicted S18 family serine protease
MTVQDIQEDISEVQETVTFIKEKMTFLENKISLAGGIAEAKAALPMAWKRFCLGPQLLLEEEKKLLALRKMLTERHSTL